MKLKGTNASSKKTKTLIKNAFADLIAEKKEVKNITVQAITKKANLTRGAFYSHYDNIYELINEFQEEILTNVLTNEQEIKTAADIDFYFDNLFAYLEKNQALYQKLLSSMDALIFMERLKVKIYLALSQNLSNKNQELNLIFFNDGTINLIIKYFQGEIKQNLKEICNYIKKIAKILFINNNF